MATGDVEMDGNPPRGSVLSDKSRRKKARRSFRLAFQLFLIDVRLGLVVMCVLFAGVSAADFGLRQFGFESEWVAARHVAAAADCSVARVMKLAPSHMEQPGYWMHLDKDKDGTSCEEDAAV